MRAIVAGAVLAATLAGCAGAQAHVIAPGPARDQVSGDCAFRSSRTIIFYRLISDCASVESDLATGTQVMWYRYGISTTGVITDTSVICALSKGDSSVTIFSYGSQDTSQAAELCTSYEADNWQM